MVNFVIAMRIYRAAHIKKSVYNIFRWTGLGNYPQQESNYGPARTSFSSDSGYSGFAGNAEQPGYGPGPYGGGESLGRGGNVSRGFHPYGR